MTTTETNKLILWTCIRLGFQITDYPTDINEVKKSTIFEVLETLETCGVLSSPPEGWKLETFVDTDIAKVV